MSTLASGAIVAVAITDTSEIRIPPMIVGSAIGISTRRTICAPVRPLPLAASTVSGSTPRMPTKVFVMIGGIASRTRATVTLRKPTPRKAMKKTIRPSAGTARPMFEVLVARNW